jgi:membrane associated rhomboid family serine protease
MIEGRTFDSTNILDYLRFFTHTFGHYDWYHLSTNIFYLVLLGPILEEKYESKTFLGILIGTSVITGIFMAIISTANDFRCEYSGLYDDYASGLCAAQAWRNPYLLGTYLCCGSSERDDGLGW